MVGTLKQELSKFIDVRKRNSDKFPRLNPNDLPDIQLPFECRKTDYCSECLNAGRSRRDLKRTKYQCRLCRRQMCYNLRSLNLKRSHLRDSCFDCFSEHQKYKNSGGSQGKPLKLLLNVDFSKAKDYCYARDGNEIYTTSQY